MTYGFTARSQAVSVAAALAVIALPAGPAMAATMYSYTGNPFDTALTTPDLQGKHISASVTFASDKSSYIGILSTDDVVNWTIEIAGVPGTMFNSAINSGNSRWPLWFDIQAGAIVNWQLLAQLSPTSFYPEIYTTRNSPYASIASTADYYNLDIASSVQGVNLDNSGVWAPVPEASSFVTAAFGLLSIALAIRRKHAYPIQPIRGVS